MLKTIFELFVLYIIYKFVFEFIIPIYRTTKHLSKKMEDVQQQMKEEKETRFKNQTQSNQKSAPNKINNLKASFRRAGRNSLSTF